MTPGSQDDPGHPACETFQVRRTPANRANTRAGHRGISGHRGVFSPLEHHDTRLDTDQAGPQFRVYIYPAAACVRFRISLSGAPNSRLYSWLNSRLNWDGLSYPTSNAASPASTFSLSISRRSHLTFAQKEREPEIRHLRRRLRCDCIHPSPGTRPGRDDL